MLFNRKNSTQQRRAAAPSPTGVRRMPVHSSLIRGAKRSSGAGRSELRGARPRRNEVRALVIAALEELDRAVTSAEVYGMLDGEKPLSLIEYHLAVLVKDGV